LDRVRIEAMIGGYAGIFDRFMLIVWFISDKERMVVLGFFCAIPVIVGLILTNSAVL
jgi:hypothetical protein